MDKRIFIDEPMGLLADLHQPQPVRSRHLRRGPQHPVRQSRRLARAHQEGHRRSAQDAGRRACDKVGKRVNSVVNHDGWQINEALYDDYAEMIDYMSQHYYLTTTRYATSAFARLKMKEALSKRGLQPHVFERREAAETFLEVVSKEEEKAPA